MSELKLNKLLGRYFPSFFILQVNSEKEFERIIDSDEERILSHELIHFLQDCSTTFGLINISRIVDEIKNLNRVLRNESDVLTVPISFSSYSLSVQANKDLFSCYRGCSDFTKFNKTIRINSVDIQEEDIPPYKINNIVLAFGNENLVSPHNFYFGAFAIMESMAHLIECHIYGNEVGYNSFPYDSAEMLVEFLYPKLLHDKLAIAELCEASLLYYNPGETFYLTLERMKIEEFLPQKPDDAYSYVLNNFKIGQDNDIPISPDEELMRMKDIAKKQLNDLFTVEPIKSEKWASNVVDKAVSLRINQCKSIVRAICLNDETESRSKLYEIVRNIGIPLIFNKNYQVWIENNGPKTLNTPQLFPAIYSIFLILSGHKKPCLLIKACSAGGINIDENCAKSPWKRVKDEQLCAFAQVWKMWGLEDKRIEVL